jgi:hypothetical protein
LRKGAVDFISDHPGYLIVASWHNLLRMFDVEHGAVVTQSGEVTVSGIGNRETWVETAGLAVIALLAMCGAIAVARSRQVRRRLPGPPQWPPSGPLFLWLIPVLTIVTAAPLGGLPRYRLPADPFLIMAAGIGLIFMWDLLGTRRAAGRTTMKAGGAAALLAVLVGLAGCGGGGDESPEVQPAVGSATAPASSRSEYVDKANAVCRRTAGETRALAKRVAAEPIPAAANPEIAVTRAVIEPTVRLLDRTAGRLRAVPLPSDDPATPAAYVGLFDVEAALLRERLRLGLQGQLTNSQPLQDLALQVGDEQRFLARQYGIRACDIDYRSLLFSEAPG